MCPECHRNETMVVPARVVQNWEFNKYAVSRQSKAVLTVMLTRPILNIEAENPSLFVGSCVGRCYLYRWMGSHSL